MEILRICIPGTFSKLTEGNKYLPVQMVILMYQHVRTVIFIATVLYSEQSSSGLRECKQVIYEAEIRTYVTKNCFMGK